MKTKQDLLTKMAELRACAEATTWVSAQEGSALEIGLRTDRIDWLIWLIGRIDPVAIACFARRCADRAKTYDAHYARYAAHYARYARYAADAACYARYAAERDAQRTDLRAMWIERDAQRTDLHAMWIEQSKGV